MCCVDFGTEYAMSPRILKAHDGDVLEAPHPASESGFIHDPNGYALSESLFHPVLIVKSQICDFALVALCVSSRWRFITTHQSLHERV